MDIVTWGHNPWGEDILLHASWDLLSVAVIAAVLFALLHAIAEIARPPAAASDGPGAQGTANVPERVERHSIAARRFHWVMAASMVALLATAFLPVIGVPFAWVTLHWIAGLLLTGAVVHHAVYAPLRQDFWSIWPDGHDLREVSSRARLAIGLPAPAPRRPGKYPVANKLFHLLALLAGVGAIVTGVLMLKRVRVPFLARNPYMLGDQAWGIIYVVHGFAGIALVALTIVHLYFALRPAKWPITRSMLGGWITGRDYLANHDPERWAVTASRGERPRVRA